MFDFENCSDLLWEKNVLVIEIFLDNSNNSFLQWKVRTISETEYILKQNVF